MLSREKPSFNLWVLWFDTFEDFCIHMPQEVDIDEENWYFK